MKNGLDLLIEAYVEECENAKRKPTAIESGTEQFEEMVEKYQRPNFDDEER